MDCKQSYNMAFKEKVIADAEKGSNRGTAKKSGVNKKHVRDLRKVKNLIHKGASERKRLDGGGRKQLLEADIESQLVRWIETQKSQNL